MVDSWLGVTGGGVLRMEKQPDLGQDENHTSLKEVEQILHEFQIKDALLFDHAPVLRIQISEEQFAHALQVRETLVERIKPLGYRFIALDLDEL
jgi:PP-loop superfamily ATP-utilizing enzyme